MGTFRIHPELPAVDIRRALEWYRDKLGLEPVSVNGEPYDSALDQRFEEMLYDTGSARFGVYESPHAGRNLATAARLVTDDFDALFSQLVARGVEFEVYPTDVFDTEGEPPPRWENGALVFPDGEKTAWFTDSEGNILALGSSD